uniref:Cystatin domain-containing protein n=1 Tax=Trichuris muris TaxID=70415 RepID=A0A5S6QUK2_TRIMR
MVTRRCRVQGTELDDLPTILVILYLAFVETCVGETMVGGLQVANIGDGKLKEMANIGVDFLNKKLDETQLLKLVRIEEAHTQVAQGKVYHLKLNVARTNCTKDMEKEERSNCEATEENAQKLCSVKVWEWRQKLKVTKGDCSNDTVEQVSQTTAQLTETTSNLLTTVQTDTVEVHPLENVTHSTNRSIV